MSNNSKQLLWPVIVVMYSLCIVMPVIATKKTSYEPSLFKKILLLDYVGRESEVYKPFCELAQSVGIVFDYRSFDQMLDTNKKNIISLYSMYDGVCIVLNNELLSLLNTKNQLIVHVHTTLNYFSKKQGAFIGILFPDFIIQDLQQSMVKQLKPIFCHLSQHAPDKNSTTRNYVNQFFQAADYFLARPMQTRSRGYHTTLQAPMHGKPFGKHVIKGEYSATLALLPMGNSFEHTIQRMAPFGLYWFNEQYKNHIFIGWESVFTSCSIVENFRLCPLKFGLREKFFQAQQQVLWELALFMYKKNNAASVDQSIAKLFEHGERPALPAYIRNFGVNTSNATKHGVMRKIAWMEIPFFTPIQHEATITKQDRIIQEQKQEKQQNELITYIVTGGLDTLWITINPHMLYSPIGRDAHKKDALLAGIGVFTKKLAQQCKLHKKKVPAILVGFEIANNLYEPHLPKNRACDAYGIVYQDLPAPLDRFFWQQEIIDSLKKFVQTWKNEAISHGVKLAGVAFDLEMYCRKKAGLFSEVMGFELATFKHFAKNKGIAGVQLQKNILPLLVKKQLTTEYFSYLTNQAKELGVYLREQICKQIPDAKLMCYTPSITVNWFYKGLMAGLSGDCNNPLYLCTFNSEFNNHKEWFVRNGIKVEHASVFMLSKLHSLKQASLIKEILKRHNGVWFNRFSRLCQEYNAQDWTSIENADLSEEQKKLLMPIIAAM